MSSKSILLTIFIMFFGMLHQIIVAENTVPNVVTLKDDDSSRDLSGSYVFYCVVCSYNFKTCQCGNSCGSSFDSCADCVAIGNSSDNCPGNSPIPPSGNSRPSSASSYLWSVSFVIALLIASSL